jgi:hypothetical protein
MRRVRHQESTPSPAGGVWRGWRTGDPRRWLRQWVFCPCTGPTWGPCCGNRYLAAHDRARNAAGGGRAARDRVSGSRCGAAAGRLCRAVVRHGDVVHGLAGHARRRERVSGVHTRLRPGCRFVASITHPCTDTPFRVWEKDQSGAKRWLCIDRYFERGSFEYTWSEWGQDLTTEGFRAPQEDWFGWILDAGFQLRAFKEPRPTDTALRTRPDLEDAARVPYYVVFDLVRP